MVLGEAVLTSTHNLCFDQKYEKNISVFLSENVQFLELKISIYLKRRVFVMKKQRLIKLRGCSKLCFFPGKMNLFLTPFQRLSFYQVSQTALLEFIDTSIL